MSSLSALVIVLCISVAATLIILSTISAACFVFFYETALRNRFQIPHRVRLPAAVLETFISALLADSLSIVASRKNATGMQYTQKSRF